MSNSENATIEFKLQNPIERLAEDPYFAIVDLTLLYINDDEHPYNTNHYHIGKEAVERAIPSFYDKPITFRYNSKLSGAVTDVTEHSHSQEEKFDLRIGGHIPSRSKVRLEKGEDGVTYVKCKAILQKVYIPKLMQILKKNDGQMSVSIEINFQKGAYDKENDVIYIEDFNLIGVTILSPLVQPGIENSNIKVLEFSDKEYNVAYFSYIKNKEEEQKLSIEDELKNSKLEFAELETKFTKLDSKQKETLKELEKVNADFAALQKRESELTEANQTLTTEKEEFAKKLADYETVKEELASFKAEKERAALEQKMTKELEDNSICFNATEFKDLKNRIKDIKYEDFAKEIATKKNEFIAGMKAQLKAKNDDKGFSVESFSYKDVLSEGQENDKISESVEAVTDLLNK